MPTDTTRAASRLTDGYDVLGMDPEYVGSCPCFGPVDLDGTLIEGHCWRVCSECDGCGIHFEGDRAVAERVKPLLDDLDWYGEWAIRKGLRYGDVPVIRTENAK